MVEPDFFVGDGSFADALSGVLAGFEILGKIRPVLTSVHKGRQKIPSKESGKCVDLFL